MKSRFYIYIKGKPRMPHSGRYCSRLKFNIRRLFSMFCLVKLVSGKHVVGGDLLVRKPNQKTVNDIWICIFMLGSPANKKSGLCNHTGGFRSETYLQPLQLRGSFLLTSNLHPRRKQMEFSESGPTHLLDSLKRLCLEPRKMKISRKAL